MKIKTIAISSLLALGASGCEQNPFATTPAPATPVTQAESTPTAAPATPATQAESAPMSSTPAMTKDASCGATHAGEASCSAGAKEASCGEAKCGAAPTTK